MTAAELDAVLGAVQVVFIVLIALVGVGAVWWALRNSRRRQVTDEDALQTARNDHDWNCVTGPWPHAGECVPRADTGWFGQVALEECHWVLGNTVRPAAVREDEACEGSGA